MSKTTRFLSPSEAARRLGVSIKTLRVYERRGLVEPQRAASGWRTYGPDEMLRLGEIVTLRGLGLSLAQVAVALADGAAGLEPALAAHQAALEDRRRQIDRTVQRIRTLRTELARPSVETPVATSAGAVRTAFALPWPWGGEPFELNDIRPINYITGPLGSGKTRLARTIADSLPGGLFVGLERLEDDGAAARQRMAEHAALATVVNRTADDLTADGANASTALIALLVTLYEDDRVALVVDLVEQGLDRATQAALVRHLRHASRPGPLFLLTRSRAILDMTRIGADETVILCPANHSPPVTVAPDPDAFGYEAVATCLASPEVRARTEGMVAVRPDHKVGVIATP